MTSGSAVTLPPLDRRIHHIRSLADWPEEIKSYLIYFSRPLPSTLTNIDPNSLDNEIARETFLDLLDDPHLNLSRPDCASHSAVGRDSERAITEMDIFPQLCGFAVVMGSVAALDYAPRDGQSASSQPARRFWLPWIAELLQKSAEKVKSESKILYDTKFILSRAQWPGSSVASLGNAALLLSTTLSSNNATPVIPIERSRSIKKEEPLEQHVPKSRDINILKEVPISAHITPGPGNKEQVESCLLPIICVAGDASVERNIVELVTSVVCQRHAWDISTPAVGLEFSDNGASARVVIGWMELNKADDGSEDLPVVNIAVPGKELTADLGVFDLSDATEVFRLAQFVLDTAPPALIKISKAIRGDFKFRDSVVQDFHWRSDYQLTLKKKIELWAAGVELMVGNTH